MNALKWFFRREGANWAQRYAAFIPTLDEVASNLHPKATGESVEALLFQRSLRKTDPLWPDLATWAMRRNHEP